MFDRLSSSKYLGDNGGQFRYDGNGNNSRDVDCNNGGIDNGQGKNIRNGDGPIRNKLVMSIDSTCLLLFFSISKTIC